MFWENRPVFVPGAQPPPYPRLHDHPHDNDGVNRIGTCVNDPRSPSWLIAQCITKVLEYASSTDPIRRDEGPEFYDKKVSVIFDPAAATPELRATSPFSVVMHYPHIFQKIRQEHALSLFESVAARPGSVVARPLYELKSPGKSGSCFFFTDDMRFVIKTILAEELASANDLVPHYFQHLRAVSDSLLCRVVGLYTLQIPGHHVNPAPQEAVMRYSLGHSTNDLYVVVMENLVPANKTVAEMYDLKGSKLGRTGGDSSIKKDLDITRKLHMGQHNAAMASALAADARFLARHNVMDYSLLLTVVKEEGANQQHCTCCGSPKSHFSCRSCALPVCKACIPDARRGVCHLCRGDTTCPLRVAAPKLYVLPEDAQIAEPVVPSVFRRDDGGFLAKHADGTPKETYHMGIIDWLQPFNWRKKAENAVKTLVQGNDISVVEPPRYAARF